MLGELLVSFVMPIAVASPVVGCCIRFVPGMFRMKVGSP